MTYKEALDIVVTQSEMVIHILENNDSIDWHTVAVGLVENAKELYEKCTG